MHESFDELQFFARIKERPALFLGRKSLIGLRDMLWGMNYAFYQCDKTDALIYHEGFVKWYLENKLEQITAYSAWWNHLLYTSGNNDDRAFDEFFRVFEEYLHEVYNLHLPKPHWK